MKICFRIYSNSNIRLFADDAVIFKTIHSDDDCQQDLDSLTSWENKWKMNFNVDKCGILHVNRKRTPKIFKYHMNKQPLSRLDEAKYLGITLTENLSWNTHINNIASKANKTLGFLRRNLRHAPIATKSMAYSSLVRPQVEYASQIWDPNTNIDKLERVQKRPARFTYNNYSTY